MGFLVIDFTIALIEGINPTTITNIPFSNIVPSKHVVEI